MEQILWRVLRAGSMIDQRVLEVGIGIGLVASTINVILLGKWKYRGTDMSPIFVKNATESFGFDVVRTDVTCLPGADGEFTRILCFDSLEHVHPEDREAGYAELARVAAKGCLLMINMPLSEDQFHDVMFDHPFGAPDFAMLKKAGLRDEDLRGLHGAGADQGAALGVRGVRARMRVALVTPWDNAWVPYFRKSIEARGHEFALYRPKMALANADVVMHGWASGDSQPLAGARNVMFLRRYELFDGGFARVDWKGVDALVCVNTWIRDVVETGSSTRTA
jgi:hypothetical protein